MKNFYLSVTGGLVLSLAVMAATLPIRVRIIGPEAAGSGRPEPVSAGLGSTLVGSVERPAGGGQQD